MESKTPYNLKQHLIRFDSIILTILFGFMFVSIIFCLIGVGYMFTINSLPILTLLSIKLIKILIGLAIISAFTELIILALNNREKQKARFEERKSLLIKELTDKIKKEIEGGTRLSHSKR